MTRFLAVLSIVLLAGCGSGESSDPGTSGPAAILKGAFTPDDIERMRTREWEFYQEAEETLPDVTGRILTPEGEPVPGATATVDVKPPIESILPLTLDTVPADDEGVFRMRDIPSNVWVFANAPGWAGRLVDVPTLFFGGDVAPPLVLRPSAVVSGRVTAPDGSPLPGATVMANTNGPDWIRHVVTDEGGRYRIEDAPRETVSVAVMPGRFLGGKTLVDLQNGDVDGVDLGATAIPPVVGVIVDEATGAPVPNAIVTGVLDEEILVRADEQGVFRMAGAIQPLIYARAWGYAQHPIRLIPDREEEQSVRVSLVRGGIVQGHVTDGEGKPVEGARVKAIVGLESGRGHLVYGPLTDADGFYDLSWLPVSDTGTEVMLVVAKPGWLGGYLDRFTVKKGEAIAGKDLSLVRPATVRARLLDASGDPLPYARFRSMWTGDAPEEVAQFMMNNTTGKSAANGEFELRGLRPGTSKLWVNAERYATWETTVTVEEGQVLEGLEFVRPIGLPVAGNLVWGSDEHPDRALVGIRAVKGPLVEDIPVGPDGSFRIDGLPPGDYELELKLPGFEPGRLTVPAGTEDCELVVRALSRIFVRVRFPEGVPMRGHLELRGIGGDATLRNPLFRDLDPDHLAWFLDNLSTGRYVLAVEAGQYYAREEFVLTRGREMNFDLELALGGTILGRVVLPDRTSPSGITVEYLPPDGGPRRGTDTDAKGRFRFAGLPPGDVKVRVHPAGYPPTEHVVTVTAGETSNVEVPVKEGGRLRVRVRTAGGEPVVDAKVGLVDADGEPARYWLTEGEAARTSADGTLVFVGISPGTYAVAAVHGEAESGTVDVEIEDGRQTEVELTLSR